MNGGVGQQDPAPPAQPTSEPLPAKTVVVEVPEQLVPDGQMTPEIQAAIDVLCQQAAAQQAATEQAAEQQKQQQHKQQKAPEYLTGWFVSYFSWLKALFNNVSTVEPR